MCPNGVEPIPALSCKHEEADTRVLIHTVYNIEQEHSDRIVIYAQDTDVIVMAVYYSANWPDIEIFVKRQADQFIPVHEISQKLGADDCKLQPILHALSGIDDTIIGRIKDDL